jgi:hypothetical protein
MPVQVFIRPDSQRPLTLRGMTRSVLRLRDDPHKDEYEGLLG